jgi:hypothetical protein
VTLLSDVKVWRRWSPRIDAEPRDNRRHLDLASMRHSRYHPFGARGFCPVRQLPGAPPPKRGGRGWAISPLGNQGAGRGFSLGERA